MANTKQLVLLLASSFVLFNIVSGDITSIPLKTNKTLFYYAQITLGSSNQPLSVLIDTKLADFWVVGSSCKTAYCASRTAFDSSASTTFVDKKKNEKVDYGSNYWIKGKYGEDTLEFTGTSLTLPNQDVLLAYESHGFSSDQAYDGVMGLAYSKNIQSNTRLTSYENAFVQNIYLQKIFSLKILRDAGSDNGGTLIIGGVDPNVYTAPISFVPVTQTGQWRFRASKISIGSDVIQKKGDEFRIETGFPFIGVPNGALNKISKYLGAKYNKTSKSYSVNCTLLTASPATNFIVEIKGISYPIAPSAYIIQDTDSNCYLGLSSQSNWILGTPFLASYYTVYDASHNRIGFANYTASTGSQVSKG